MTVNALRHLPAVIAAVLVSSAVALLHWSGLPPEFWPCAVCVTVLLVLAGASLASAAVGVARWLRGAR